MPTRYHFHALFLLVAFGGATGAEAQVNPQFAQRYFQEVRELCERDAGRLWGVSLCGPMVIFDQATGTRATSEPEPEGPPPRFPGQADGPVSWGGRLRWFAYPWWMLPEHDAGARQQNMLHGLFEAASGPAYGVLLDELMPEWRRQLRSSSDLGDMLASAADRPPMADLAAAAARYNGATLRAAEEARDRAQQIRVAELRQRFVDGPVLTMPAGGSGTSDTRGSVGITGVGTVFFNNFTLSAQWGRLSADSGVLRSAEGRTLSVPVTGPLEGTNLRGDGWSVTSVASRINRWARWREG
jgi:hypothetical protein